MNITDMKELLKSKYGIASDKELDEAMKKCSVNLGIFVSPFAGKSNNERRVR